MRHHTALQYARALNSLIDESPTHSDKILKDFVHTLSKNDDIKLAGDIIHHFEKIIHTHTEKKEKGSMGGVRIQIGDVVVDNTINQRLKNLKALIG